jgi:hypothetical protein
MCWATFSWTCVPSSSVAVLAEATDHWARILCPTTSSDSTPQQSPDPYCWESEGEPKSFRTCCRLKRGVLLVERRVISLTDAPTHAHASIRQLQLHLFPTRIANSVPVATKQNYACGRVNHVAVEEAKKLLMLSLVCFSLMILLQ